MDIKITELELLLDKINLLFNDVKADGKIDPVEAGLFLKYIKQLEAKIQGVTQQTIVKPVAELKEHIIPEVIKPTEQKVETPVVKTIEKEVVPEKQEAPEKINKVEEIKKEIVEEMKPPVVKEEKKEVPVAKHKKPLISIPDDDEEEVSHTGLNNKLLKEKKTLADKIVNKKAMDLRTAIDLNDRIYFIKVLFNGDSHAYDKAIKHLNAVQSQAELKTYINTELSTQYKWDDHDAAERFNEVAGRKFE